MVEFCKVNCPFKRALNNLGKGISLRILDPPMEGLEPVGRRGKIFKIASFEGPMILSLYQKLPSFAQIPHFILEKNPEDDVSRRHFQTCPSYHRSRKRSRTKKRHGWIPPGCGLVLCRFCFSLSFFRTRIQQLLFKWDSAKMLEICVIFTILAWNSEN